ncbi:MAG: hypothetical protein QNJ15_01420 [Erythrobacter sp.]|nr:hypothetical protein [Erythrobacter sp.]
MKNVDEAHVQAVDSPRAQSADARTLDPDRFDGYVMLAVGLVGTALFAPAIDWIAYFILFWIIDVVGYWPGVTMCRVAKSRQIPSVFTHLYNLMHSNSGALILVLGYALLFPGSVAAALAIPVHLGIDRGILGNRLKRPDDAF